MDARTYEIIIEVLTDKVDLLGWQLKNAEDERAKLKAEKKELEKALKDMTETEGEKENA